MTVCMIIYLLYIHYQTYSMTCFNIIAIPNSGNYNYYNYITTVKPSIRDPCIKDTISPKLCFIIYIHPEIRTPL